MEHATLFPNHCKICITRPRSQRVPLESQSSRPMHGLLLRKCKPLPRALLRHVRPWRFGNQRKHRIGSSDSDQQEVQLILPNASRKEKKAITRQRHPQAQVPDGGSKSLHQTHEAKQRRKHSIPAWQRLSSDCNCIHNPARGRCLHPRGKVPEKVHHGVKEKQSYLSCC